MRVILDLSALHGERLSLLKAAPLDLLRRRGHLTFLHTPIFLEEILRGSRAPRLGERWRENLAFALNLKPAGYFLDKVQIWRDELVCGRGPYARHMMPKRSTRRWDAVNTMEESLRRVVTTGDIGDAWAAAGPEIADASQKRQNQRRIAVEIREDIATRLRTGNVRGRLSDMSFHPYLRRDRQTWGNELMDLVESRRPDPLRAQWNQNPCRYPFYTSFVEGIAFFGFHSGVLQNEPVDTNAQSDFEQLCYLNWADVFVSNDESFLRSAFDALWKPRGKRLFTCEDFVALAARLS